MEDEFRGNECKLEADVMGEKEILDELDIIANAIVQVVVQFTALLYLKIPEIQEPIRNILKNPPPCQQKNDSFYLGIIEACRGVIEYLEEVNGNSYPEWYQGLIAGGKDGLGDPRNQGDEK